jgi:polar amino acid transport system substrate-binding protein
MMKKILALLMAAVMACALFSGCGGEQKNTAAQNDNGKKKIVVGLDDNFPPMGFKDEKNEIVGFDIDMAKEAVKRLGYDVEFKAIDWSSKEAELKSGRIDVLWNGLNITEKRKENMLFSDSYMEAKQLIFIPKDSSIKGEADLKGKAVGIQSASTADENLDADTALRDSFKELKKYQDCIAAMMDLENGRIDAIITDEIVGRYYMSKKQDKFIALETPVGPIGDYGIGFRKEDKELRDTIQKALNEMKADGTAAKISEKWFGKDILK